MGGYTVLISGDPIGDIFYQDLDRRISSTGQICLREKFFLEKSVVTLDTPPGLVLWPP